MEQMNDLVWSNERRRLGDLVPWPRNPRQIKRGLSARDRTPRRGDVFETLQRYFVDHVVTTKLVVSEARNFPEIAQFYYDKVIHRSRLQLLRVVERAISRGEFRPLDVKATVDAIILPILMMAIWRHSLCDCGPMSDPQLFLSTLSDILVSGLRKE